MHRICIVMLLSSFWKNFHCNRTSKRLSGVLSAVQPSGIFSSISHGMSACCFDRGFKVLRRQRASIRGSNQTRHCWEIACHIWLIIVVNHLNCEQDWFNDSVCASIVGSSHLQLCCRYFSSLESYLHAVYSGMEIELINLSGLTMAASLC